MRTAVTKAVLASLMVAMVVPESYAKRLGGGRSVGRQTQMSRQRAMPPAPRPRYTPPAVARTAPVPPRAVPAPVPVPVRPQPNLAGPRVYPGTNIPRQASSPWRGMLGGVLVGLGLGSLMTSSTAHETPAAVPPPAPALPLPETAPVPEAASSPETQAAATGPGASPTVSAREAMGLGVDKADAPADNSTPANRSAPAASGNW